MIQESLEATMERIADDCVYSTIKRDLIAAIHRYVFQGIPPGSFLTAVLCNDLREAVGRADLDNYRNLKSIVTYCYQELPAAAWGSPNRFDTWLRRFNDKGDTNGL